MFSLKVADENLKIIIYESNNYDTFYIISFLWDKRTVNKKRIYNNKLMHKLILCAQNMTTKFSFTFNISTLNTTFPFLEYESYSF